MRKLDAIEHATLLMGLDAEIVRMRNLLPRFKSPESKEIIEERIAAAETLRKQMRNGDLYVAVRSPPKYSSLPF